MKKEINGTEYTFQKLPVREAMKLRQSWGDNTKPAGVDDIIMADKVLEHLVIMPKVTMEDFTSISALEDVVTEAILFQYGDEEK